MLYEMSSLVYGITRLQLLFRPSQLLSSSASNPLSCSANSGLTGFLGLKAGASGPIMQRRDNSSKVGVHLSSVAIFASNSTKSLSSFGTSGVVTSSLLIFGATIQHLDRYRQCLFVVIGAAASDFLGAVQLFGQYQAGLTDGGRPILTMTR